VNPGAIIIVTVQEVCTHTLYKQTDRCSCCYVCRKCRQWMLCV